LYSLRDGALICGEVPELKTRLKKAKPPVDDPFTADD